MVLDSAPDPAGALATLRSEGLRIQPTERWVSGWSSGSTTTDQNVYGLYARAIPMVKWLAPGVRDLLDHYPGDVGRGTMPPGIGSFVVPDTDEAGVGPWVLLYVGQSASKTPRVIQYFGRGPAFTREPGGQSLHLTLALFFGGDVDPRVALPVKARSLENVVRGSLSLSLESRMREMRVAYVQVKTPTPTEGHPSGRCTCCGCSEVALIGGRLPSDGARPLINSMW